MKLGNYDISFNGITRIQNVDVSKPAGSKLITRITQQQLTRSNQDINKWRSALSQAESKTRPDRLTLFRIYQDVVLDPHLSAVMDQRKNKVLSRGFKIVDEDKEEIEDATKLLNSAWFERFISLALDAKFYGFSLIEFGAVVEDAFTMVELVPREYVVPERGIFRTALGSGKEFNYNKPPFDKWALFVGETTDLGLLNKATPIILWKRLVQATWAEYNELYGVPLRIGKTDTRNPDARGNMEKMLSEMGSSAWGLFDEEDQIEIINGTKVGGQGTFKDFINLADEQISKLFLGQTMTTDDGSSRSQAEVHADTLASFTGADMRWIEHVVNNMLIPFATRLGLNFMGGKFMYDTSEKLSLSDQFNIDKELLQHYKIPAEYIEGKYGTPVEEVEAVAAPQPGNVVNMTNDLASLYKGFFEHGEGCACGNCK